MSTTFNVSKRDNAGKGAARAVRKQGNIPAVIYGDKKEPTLISVRPIELKKEMHKEGFFSHVFALTLDGKAIDEAIVKDVQFHPVTDRPLHVDFLRVSEDSQISVMVPVHFLNEEKSFGLKRGGILNVVRHEVEVSCTPKNIPEYLEVDLAEGDIGDSFKISAVSLPENVVPTIADRDFVIATITGKGASATEEDEDTTEITEEETVETTEEETTEE